MSSSWLHPLSWGESLARWISRALASFGSVDDRRTTITVNLNQPEYNRFQGLAAYKQALVHATSDRRQNDRRVGHRRQNPPDRRVAPIQKRLAVGLGLACERASICREGLDTELGEVERLIHALIPEARRYEYADSNGIAVAPERVLWESVKATRKWFHTGGYGSGSAIARYITERYKVHQPDRRQIQRREVERRQHAIAA